MTLRAGKVVVVSVSCILLTSAWLSIILAIKAGAVAVSLHGYIGQTLLDAKLGYLGLLSFGLSASALLMLTVLHRSAIPRKLLNVFRVTFFVSIPFFFPVLFAILLFLSQ